MSIPKPVATGVKGAAAYTGLSESYIRDQLHANEEHGGIRGRRIGVRWSIHYSDLDAWLLSHPTESEEQATE